MTAPGIFINHFAFDLWKIVLHSRQIYSESKTKAFIAFDILCLDS